MAKRRIVPPGRDRPARSGRPSGTTRRPVRAPEPPPVETTLNRFGTPLPVEIHNQIADALPTSDLKAYMRVSQLMHDVGSQIMYHTVSATHDTAVQVFSSLVLRFRPSSAGHYRQAPALSVRVLTYTSSSSEEDLRALPLLCDLLLRTTDLRHLALEIPDDSSPVLLTLMKRRGLLRRSISPVATAFHCVDRDCKRLASPLTLPRLSSFHTSCFRVLGEVGRHRRLTAIGLSEIIGRLETIMVLEELAGAGVNEVVQAFSCFYDVLDSPKGQLWAVGTCFPNLTYLGLDLPTRHALFSEETYAIMTGLMLNMASAMFSFGCLETLSLEFPWSLHGLTAPLMGRIDVERVQAIFNVFASTRPRFRTVLLSSITLGLNESNGRWQITCLHNTQERGQLRTAGTTVRVPLY